MMMPFMSLTSYRRGAQAAESPEEGTDTAAALVDAMEAACEGRGGVLRPPRSASLFGATKPSALKSRCDVLKS